MKINTLILSLYFPPLNNELSIFTKALTIHNIELKREVLLYTFNPPSLEENSVFNYESGCKIEEFEHCRIVYDQSQNPFFFDLYALHAENIEFQKFCEDIEKRILNLIKDNISEKVFKVYIFHPVYLLMDKLMDYVNDRDVSMFLSFFTHKIFLHQMELFLPGLKKIQTFYLTGKKAPAFVQGTKYYFLNAVHDLKNMIIKRSKNDLLWLGNTLRLTETQKIILVILNKNDQTQIQNKDIFLGIDKHSNIHLGNYLYYIIDLGDFSVSEIECIRNKKLIKLLGCPDINYLSGYITVADFVLIGPGIFDPFPFIFSCVAETPVLMAKEENPIALKLQEQYGEIFFEDIRTWLESVIKNEEQLIKSQKDKFDQIMNEYDISSVPWEIL